MLALRETPSTRLLSTSDRSNNAAWVISAHGKLDTRTTGGRERRGRLGAVTTSCGGLMSVAKI